MAGDKEDGGGKKTNTVDVMSPLYLSHSENPGAVITQCIFEGDNYDLWSKSIINAF